MTFDKAFDSTKKMHVSARSVRSTPIYSSKWWRPTSFKRLTLLGALSGSLLLLLATISLHYIEETHGAILFSADGDDFSMAQLFVLRYLPTILVVLYGILISVIDLDVRRLEPWVQLSSEQRKSRRHSPLHCRYDTDFILKVVVQALQRKYVILFQY